MIDRGDSYFLIEIFVARRLAKTRWTRTARAKTGAKVARFAGLASCAQGVKKRLKQPDYWNSRAEMIFNVRFKAQRHLTPLDSF